MGRASLPLVVVVVMSLVVVVVVFVVLLMFLIILSLFGMLERSVDVVFRDSSLWILSPISTRVQVWKILNQTKNERTNKITPKYIKVCISPMQAMSDHIL